MGRFTETLIVLLLFPATRGAKLLFHPANIQSHIINFGHLAAALAQEGHVTSVLVPSSARPPNASPNMETITFDVSRDIPICNTPEFSTLMMKTAFADSFGEMMDAFAKVEYAYEAGGSDDCHALFQNEKLLEKLMKANYDMVIVDSAWLTCVYTLPYKLGVPHATFTIPFSAWMSRVPALPSFVPGLLTDNSDRMSFGERLNNVMFEVFSLLFMNTTDYFINRYVPEKPLLTPKDLMLKSSLFFFIADDTLAYPSPSMPNTINIGDIMARPAGQLSKDMKQFMDAATNGVILVSFGSFVDHLPPEIFCRLARAFSHLPQSVIWRMKSKADSMQCELPPNVKPMVWFPQNDLLAHPNMKLFVSHCGFNSLMEAINHGVPIIALPLGVDQPFNAKAVQTHGYGLRLDIKNFTENELENAVNVILSDATFKDRVDKASRMIKHKPQSPAKRASFWINHVIKYGDEHLRTKAYELNDVQFFMLDIFAFVVGVLFVAGILILCCLRMAYKLCCSRLCKKGKGKDKTE